MAWLCLIVTYTLYQLQAHLISTLLTPAEECAAIEKLWGSTSLATGGTLAARATPWGTSTANCAVAPGTTFATTTGGCIGLYIYIYTTIHIILRVFVSLTYDSHVRNVRPRYCQYLRPLQYRFSFRGFIQGSGVVVISCSSRLRTSCPTRNSP